MLDGNAAQEALPLIEALADEYPKGLIDYDDSDSTLGAFFFDLAELWALALLGAPLKKAKLNFSTKDCLTKRLPPWEPARAAKI
ncbi:hypothetical protein [Candidatus Chloroploca sp. Khr17]|uniref:hypothetical protein n=1 Tax=Candidatus Chloroploca sp. Khr17 TaxID=2496869 RepID=UPI00101BD67E|nr:hypothetical protein [Candidatus Chloroploca sp. Khr17]